MDEEAKSERIIDKEQEDNKKTEEN